MSSWTRPKLGIPTSSSSVHMGGVDWGGSCSARSPKPSRYTRSVRSKLSARRWLNRPEIVEINTGPPPPRGGLLSANIFTYINATSIHRYVRNRPELMRRRDILRANRRRRRARRPSILERDSGHYADE